MANELLFIKRSATALLILLILEKKLAQPENRCLLLCSPHNPTGRVWGAMGIRANGFIVPTV